MSNQQEEGAGSHATAPTPIHTHAAAIVALTSCDWFDKAPAALTGLRGAGACSRTYPIGSPANARQQAATQAGRVQGVHHG